MLSVTVSGKPSLRPFSWKGWKSRSYIRLLSSAICEPSMLDASLNALTWWSLGSPVRTSALPDLEQASSKETAADSGTTSTGSLARWHHDTSTWRTCLPLLTEDSTPFLGRWPRAGLMRHGTVSKLATSERRTDATAGSALRGATGDRNEYPTPSAVRYGTSQNEGKVPHQRATAGTPSLHTWAKKWATPTAGDAKASGSRNAPGSQAHQGTSLTDMVKTGNSTGRNWPTAGANDWKGSSKPGQRRGQLDEAVSHRFLRQAQPPWIPCSNCDTFLCTIHSGMHAWECPCPPIEEWTTSPYSHPDPETQKHGDESLQSGPTSPRHLSATFVEYLMSFPLGWTDFGIEMIDSDVSATQSFQSWLHTHSSLLRVALRQNKEMR